MFVRKILLMVCLFLSCVPFSFSQNDFRIMFYNVENLFDTIDDPLKNDDAFLPDGPMNWQPWKYREKLRNITRVITAVGGMHSPALVGLCEIENDRVVHDLTRRSPLRAQGYEYIVTHSPDERGMDVALLYQRHRFSLLEKNEYEVVFGDKAVRPTRNILHVVGRIVSGDTLDVFVCHWPSRSGGQRESEPARLDAATLLRRKADSLFMIRKSAHIVIMGDFNDGPGDKSIFRILKAKSLRHYRSDKELYNLFSHRLKEKDFGTYFFRGRWEVLDQFIVSGNLLREDNRIYIRGGEAHIFKPGFLLQEDKASGIKRPYRTHYGPRYVGGFSDHLPVYMDMVAINSTG